MNIFLEPKNSGNNVEVVNEGIISAILNKIEDFKHKFSVGQNKLAVNKFARLIKNCKNEDEAAKRISYLYSRGPEMDKIAPQVVSMDLKQCIDALYYIDTEEGNTYFENAFKDKNERKLIYFTMNSAIPYTIRKNFPDDWNEIMKLYHFEDRMV